MWTAIFVLAIAVNFEPTRIGLIALMLSRPKPLLQLMAFLSGGVVVTTAAGFFVLFVAHRSLLGDSDFNAAKVQIASGVIALVAAVLLASKVSFHRFSRKPVSAPVAPAETTPGGVALEQLPPGVIGKLSTRARRLLEGRSPWFAAALGVFLALPSVDYLALLVLIAASEAPPATQAGALITYVAVANAVAAIPLLSFLVAPAKTRAMLTKFYSWIRARRRRDWAILVAVIGCLMIGVGINSL
jgi:Sap, sulfolipid-1-addressing protein